MVRKLARASAVTVVATAVLAGCSNPGPSELDTPKVLWPDGKPSSQYEHDPAVVALREAFVQRAVAWNALDYSDPDLVYRWGLPVYGAEESMAVANQADGKVASGLDDPGEWTMFGPTAIHILDVAAGDGASVVVACLGREFVPRDAFASNAQGSQNDLRQFAVEMFPDGSTTITSVGLGNDFNDAFFDQCREAELVRGVFEPKPKLFSGDGSDVKLPAPAEEYGFDNVS